MNTLRNIFLLTAVMCFTSTHSQETATFAYRQELKAFENNPRYRAIFDEDAHRDLKDIQADVENYKDLSLPQRIVRFGIFLGFEVVAITPETMPTLYAFVDTICKEQRIETPTVFIAKDRGLFNAFAQKLLVSSGAIVISKKLLEETTDRELQAVVAHELGHIVHNHVNKGILIWLASYWGTVYAWEYFLGKPNAQDLRSCLAVVCAQSVIALCVDACIINKRFEKEADEFAYKVTNNSEGLIEFFEHIKNKEQSVENDFAATLAIVKDNKAKIGYSDYYYLMFRYYMAKTRHVIGSGFKWIYHNTPLGAHPSHDDRIKAAKEYLAQQS